MNKKNLFRAALIILVSTISLVSSARGKSEKSESPKFYFNNSGTKELAASREVYEMDAAGKYLTRKYRYEFTYDAQNRVVEKRILKWGVWGEEWSILQKLNYTYTPESIIIELSYWNRATESFDKVSEKSVYGVDTDHYTSYAGYERKSTSDEWQLVQYFTTNTPSLFPLSQDDHLIAEKEK